MERKRGESTAPGTTKLGEMEASRRRNSFQCPREARKSSHFTRSDE